MKLTERIQRLILAGAGALGEVDRQAVLNELADMRCPRVQRYITYERYYDGDIGAKLTGRAKEYLEREGFPYVENFCEPIVDALAQALELNTVALAGDDPDDEAYSDWVRAVWQANRMDDLQGVVHTQAPMKGDYYVIVDWDPMTELPRFTAQRPDICRPVYDEHGRMMLFAKTWDEARAAKTNPNGVAIRRLNLYFPDRVEKWYTPTAIDPGAGVQTAIWAAHVDHGDEDWPVDWTDNQGEPLGIAVGHFRNKPKGSDWGKSELKSVIPQQNALTKYLVDLAEVLDYQGGPQRWATGVDKASVFKSLAGSVWTTANEGATFGQYDPANPQGILESVEQMMRRIAARSQTPLHQLMTGGQNPSGETLKAANRPLTLKAKDRQTSYGGVWVDLHLLALKLHALHTPGFPIDPNEVELEASWESAEIVDLAADLAAAETKHRLGVSKHTLLTELGYDPAEEAELRAAEAEAAAAAMVDAFNRGGGPPPPGNRPPPGPDQPNGNGPPMAPPAAAAR